MNYKIAMFPGTFDPVTYGHVDIISRISRLYDKVYVVVADNRNKNRLFSTEERVSFVKSSVKKIKNVEVCSWDGLLVDFAKEYDVGVVIRGVRNNSDFEYEFEVSELNKSLCPQLEYLFMPTSASCALLRSSYVKELASFGADVSAMVPKEVAKALLKAYKG